MEFINIYHCYAVQTEEKLITAIQELAKSEKIKKPVIITDCEMQKTRDAFMYLGVSNHEELFGRDLRMLYNGKLIRVIHVTDDELNSDLYPHKILQGYRYDGLVCIFDRINMKWYGRFIVEAHGRVTSNI